MAFLAGYLVSPCKSLSKPFTGMLADGRDDVAMDIGVSPSASRSQGTSSWASSSVICAGTLPLRPHLRSASPPRMSRQLDRPRPASQSAKGIFCRRRCFWENIDLQRLLTALGCGGNSQSARQRFWGPLNGLFQLNDVVGLDAVVARLVIRRQLKIHCSGQGVRFGLIALQIFNDVYISVVRISA